MNDKTTGWTVLIGSILGIIIYFYLIFLSPWSSLTIEVSAFFAVGARVCELEGVSCGVGDPESFVEALVASV